MLTEPLVAAAIGRALAQERFSPADLADLQLHKFRELARFAAERSAFYRRLYQGIDLASVAPADLPTVTKPQIQEHFDEAVTDPRLKRGEIETYCQQPPRQASPWHLGEFAVLLSSGTTGQRGYFVMDGPALADAIAMGFRQSTRRAAGGPRPAPVPGADEGAAAGDHPPQERIAAVMLVEPYDSACVLTRLIPERVGPKALIDIRKPFADICGELNSFRPTLLLSFPCTLRMLSQAQQTGDLSISPARITSSGGVLTPSDRANVCEAFGIEPFDYYCSTEATYIAWECDAHQGLHVNTDFVLIESVDGANRPVPAGRLGAKLLMTNLSNRALPLIRYEMSDQVAFCEGPCPCGCLLPRIQSVAGRVEEIIVLPGAAGGRIALIPENIDEFVGSLTGLANYQVIQEAAARLTVNLVPASDTDSARMTAAVREALVRCFAHYSVALSIELDLRRVEALEPVKPGSNKVCQYWNRAR